MYEKERERERKKGRVTCKREKRATRREKKFITNICKPLFVTMIVNKTENTVRKSVYILRVYGIMSNVEFSGLSTVIERMRERVREREKKIVTKKLVRLSLFFFRFEATHAFVRIPRPKPSNVLFFFDNVVSNFRSYVSSSARILPLFPNPSAPFFVQYFY